MTTIDDSTIHKPHVSFLNTCELIPDEVQSSSLLFGLHTKSISLHLSLPHRRRAPSQDSNSDKPTLTVKVPSFSPRHKQNHVTSPTSPCAPPPGILKRSPSISSNHSIESKITSPPRQRGRALSGTASPPPESVPLSDCCEDCLPAVQLAQRLGSKYKVTWTPGALAKKKRDDDEEQRDILAGLKQGCLIKWAELQRECEEKNPDAGGCNGEDNEDEDEMGSKHSSSCLSIQNLAEAHQPDALSQLDGTKNKSNLRSTFSSNKDWSPTKYYNSQDDEDDLFPLPSPKLTPPTTSPSTSQINLTDSPVSASERSSFSPQAGLAPPVSYPGLPTIVSANTSRAPSRSSISSVSSSTHSQSRRHSPLVPLYPPNSSHLQPPKNDSPSHSRHPSDPSTRSKSSRTSNSSVTSSSNSSGMVWQFVPPPLPTKGAHPRTSRSGLTAAENTTSAFRESKKVPSQKEGNAAPLTLVSSRNTITPASAKGSINGSTKQSQQMPLQPSAGLGINGLVTSERANPPHMPTYSGKQREIVVIASSSAAKKGSVPTSSPNSKAASATSQASNAMNKTSGKSLPPIPPSQAQGPPPTLARQQSASSSSNTTPTPTPGQTPPPSVVYDHAAAASKASGGNLRDSSRREKGTLNLQRTSSLVAVDEHGSLGKEVYNAGVSAGVVPKGSNNAGTWNADTRNRSSSIRKMLSGIAAGLR